jgi:hypothetical protein
VPEQDQPPKSPAKKAAPRKAPTKKAAPKKAAPKAAPKKTAPAKAGTPRDAILSRIAELEERISAEPPRKALPAEELAAQAPQKPVAVKRPAPRKPAAPPVKRPVTKAAPPVPAVVEAHEPVAQELEGPPPVPVEPVQETVLAPAPIVPEPARPAPQAGEQPPADAPTWRPLVAAAIVVLLTVAAGLGAAALARSQPATWSSSSVVTLSAVSPSASASAVPTGVDRYQERAQSSSFTAVSLFQAGLKQSDLRALLKARDGAPDQIVLQAKASSKAGAAKLAAAAGRALVMAVTASEAQVADQDERLSATATLASDPRRESPSNRDVWLAGLLAAVACLLVTTLVAVLRTGQKISQEPARGSRA